MGESAGDSLLRDRDPFPERIHLEWPKREAQLPPQ